MVVVVLLLFLVFVVDVFVVVVVKTPTQPQHNLTQPEVGFDMIIAVHTPPTPPTKTTTRNSTSPRSKGPEIFHAISSNQTNNNQLFSGWGWGGGQESYLNKEDRNV